MLSKIWECCCIDDFLPDMFGNFGATLLQTQKGKICPTQNSFWYVLYTYTFVGRRQHMRV